MRGARAGEDHRVAAPPGAPAALPLDQRGPAELSHPDDERLVEQAPGLQVFEQAGDRAVHPGAAGGQLGVDPREKPSARLAAISSFLMFAIGAIIPIIPYLLGFSSLTAGLACGGAGLLLAGGLAARFTAKPVWWAAGRQLLFGAVAIAATDVVGHLIASVV